MHQEFAFSAVCGETPYDNCHSVLAHGAMTELFVKVTFNIVFSLWFCRVKGKHYFDCPPLHGVMVRPDKVKVRLENAVGWVFGDG